MQDSYNSKTPVGMTMMATCLRRMYPLVLLSSLWSLPRVTVATLDNTGRKGLFYFHEAEPEHEHEHEQLLDIPTNDNPTFHWYNEEILDNEPCLDSHENCWHWAKQGECHQNPKFMHGKCPKSCHICNNTTTMGEWNARNVLCQDHHETCNQWASQGECNRNPQFMHEKCPKSCQICHDTTDLELVLDHDALSRNDGPCQDSHEMCWQWAFQGECNNNPQFMHVKCRKSCQICQNTTEFLVMDYYSSSRDEPCQDHHEKCMLWALHGECFRNSAYMKVQCPKSCQICTKATDIVHEDFNTIKEEHCQDDHDTRMCMAWASNGECSRNPEYMKIQCRKSCQLCKVANNKKKKDKESVRVEDEDDLFCMDQHGSCQDWAKSGECTLNRSYMNLYCPKSCQCRKSCELCKKMVVMIMDDGNDGHYRPYMVSYHQDHRKFPTSARTSKAISKTTTRHGFSSKLRGEHEETEY